MAMDPHEYLLSTFPELGVDFAETSGSGSHLTASSNTWLHDDDMRYEREVMVAHLLGLLMALSFFSF